MGRIIGATWAIDSTTSSSCAAAAGDMAVWSVGWDIKFLKILVFAKISSILPIQTLPEQSKASQSRHTSGMKQPLLIKSAIPLLCIALFAVLAGCAASGPNSPSAKPVLYPNAALTRVGEVQARAETDGCMAKAAQAGLTPDQKTNLRLG